MSEKFIKYFKGGMIIIRKGKHTITVFKISGIAAEFRCNLSVKSSGNRTRISVLLKDGNPS